MKLLISTLCLFALFGCSKPEPRDITYVCMTALGGVQVKPGTDGAKEDYTTLFVEQGGNQFFIPKGLCVQVKEAK